MHSNRPPLLDMANKVGDVGCDCVPAPERPALTWMVANRPTIHVVHLRRPERYYWLPRHSPSWRGCLQVIKPEVFGDLVLIRLAQSREAAGRPWVRV